jgi:hypothetical protein
MQLWDAAAGLTFEKPLRILCAARRSLTSCFKEDAGAGSRIDVLKASVSLLTRLAAD